MIQSQLSHSFGIHSFKSIIVCTVYVPTICRKTFEGKKLYGFLLNRVFFTTNTSNKHLLLKEAATYTMI